MMFCSCSCEKKTSSNDDKLPAIGGETQEETLPEKKAQTYRLVSYNVGSFGKYTNSSEKMIADMMDELKTDAMGLNEVDYFNKRHNTDQVANMAAYIGWDCYFAKAMDWNGGQYGNALAWSKNLKALDTYTIELPKQTGSENRSCGVVEFEDFVLAVTHLEVKTENDRLAGVKIITEKLSEKYGKGKKPVLLCGDMNDGPKSNVVAAYKENWTQLTPNENTIPSTNPTNCIDFFFALNGAGAYTVVSAGVPKGFTKGDLKQASDHLPVYIDIKIEK